MQPLVWQLSDGTTVTTDGAELTVAGDSELAQYMRVELAQGEAIPVSIDPQPGGDRLAPGRGYTVNAWIEQWIRLEGAGVLVSVRPEFEPPPEVTGADTSGYPDGLQPVY
jgi:hypothetical protein